MKSLLFVLTFSFLSPLTAAGSSSDTIKEFADHVRKFTLSNGMRFLVYERPETPTVSFSMYIRTGGIDDESGFSGMAHMFEHMFFKGTKTIETKDYASESKVMDKIDAAEISLIEESDKGVKTDPPRIKELQAEISGLEAEESTYIVEEEYWGIYERAGGQDLNASTGFDYTNYVISLPANKVELWMAMESDRVKNPVLREFYKERDVVREERRMRIDNSPDGKLWEEFLGAAFLAHPYGRPIVGWDSDLTHLTRPLAEKFFKKHYDVSRLVVAIVGGIKAEEVEKSARKYFDSIPSVEKSNGEEEHISVEPPQTGERRVVVEYDAEPSLLIGYHRPNLIHPDNYALEVLAQVLDEGRTSRLYKNVVEKKAASSAWASSSAPGERDPNLFMLGGTPIAPNTPQDLEKKIYREIEKLKEKGPTEKELEKVKNNLEADTIRGLSSNMGLANQLAYYESVAGDWKYLLALIQGLRNVTDIDVQRVADKYFAPSNRTVAWIEKKAPKDDQ